MRYPYVLLDAGGTLFGPRESFGAVYARVLERMGLTRGAEIFDSAIRETWREMDLAVPRGDDRYSFFEGGEHGFWLRFAGRAIERAAGGPAPARFVESALGALREAFRAPDAWRVYPDVRPALADLRRLGARLAVVSNWDSRLPHLLQALDLAPLFDVVTFSHAIGVEKPDPRIFSTALSALDADPACSIHVGDVPELDLDGARAAGIDAVLLDRRDRPDPAMGAYRDLGPLPRIVREGLP